LKRFSISGLYQRFPSDHSHLHFILNPPKSLSSEPSEIQVHRPLHSQKNILQNGSSIPAAPSNHGPVPVLLLQSRPQVRQSATWPFLAASKCSDPGISANAAAPIHSHLLETNIIVFSTSIASSNVHCRFPPVLDSHGLSKAHVPEAHNFDSGPLSETNTRVRGRRQRPVLLSSDPSSFGIRQRHQ